MLELKNYFLRVNNETLVKDLSFSVSNGEILTVMGPSGSGKSSILQYILGFESNNLNQTGEVVFNDQIINEISPEKRKIGLIFQDDLLFPHLTVLGNLIIGIPNDKHIKNKKNLALKALEECELSGFENRKIDTISGGQRARLSLWRTLLSEPQAILLDEPFAKLDSSLKKRVRNFFYKHIKKKSLPTILVTHDIEDANWANGKIINIAKYSN